MHSLPRIPSACLHGQRRLRAFAKYLVALGVLAALANPGGSDAHAQSPAPAPSQAAAQTEAAEPALATQQEEIQKKIESLDERIATAEERATQEYAAEIGVPLATLQDQALSLRQLRSVYEDHLSVLDERKETLRMLEELAREREEYQGIPDPPPYTPWFVDTFRDAVQTKDEQREQDQRALDQAKSRLERAKKENNRSEAELAQIKSEAAASSDPAVLRPLEGRMQAVRAAAEVLKATAALCDAQIAAAEERAALRDKQREFLNQKLEEAKSRERYRPEDLEARRQTLAKRRADLQVKLNQAITLKDAAQHKLNEARDGVQGTNGEAAAKQAAVDLLKAEASVASDNVTMLRERLDFMFREEEIWGTRYELHAEPKTFAVLDELQDAEAYAESLTSIRQTRLSRLESIRASVREWDRKLSIGLGESPEAAQARKMLKTLNYNMDTVRESLTSISSIEQLNRRLIEDLKAAQSTLTLKQRWEQYSKQASEVWNYRLPIDVGGEPLTVRQICLAGIILVCGFALTRIVRRYLRKHVFTRTRMDANSAANVDRLVHYALLILVVLFAMNTVNIPLTAFTLFGGALAIGVGFGAQNLINNFISGLILMMERPIRIGDLVELDGRGGYIEEIGARCCRLRLFSGVDLMVPNSAFLEKTVINWTLSDAKVRFTVTVGVSYGSPTRQVEEIIRKAVTEHSRVLEEPEPVVVFSEFGDNALMFEAYFWLTMGPATDARVVRSDIRHRIDALFREAGIDIAYPQRDMHLDTVTPLDVRILNGDAQTAGNPERARQRESGE
ncbi:MAG: mechanosensitive ion channel [Candidatus Hydrogenedentes bacterium]|nr:mechanosensitive ion channel [Candidatus Hydrogenedentota bacterium]